jgi:tetratricopeptide (TPR) repeat protein
MAASLDDSGMLSISYIEKTIIALNRAKAADGDRRYLAEWTDIRWRYLSWVIRVAELRPTPRNLATAIWALTELPVAELDTLSREKLTALIGQLMQTYPSAPTPSLPVEKTFAIEPAQTPPAPHTDSSGTQSDLPTLLDQQGSENNREGSLIVNLGRTIVGSATSLDFTPEQIVGTEDGRAQYQIKRVMRGGMGVVYFALDTRTNSPVALKSIQSAILSMGGDAMLQRFEHEALTWVRLGKHPHIVQALTVQTLAQRTHIVLEYIAGISGVGSDLRSWIDRGQLTLELALRFGVHIARGMMFAVEQLPGFIHRDLKPANILVTVDKQAKVTDFGLAYSMRRSRTLPEMPEHIPADERLTRAGTIMGTAQYMSPEQTRGEEVDQRSDIYAFGVILYEMLTGHPLFKASSWTEWAVAHQTQQPMFAPELRHKLPPELREFVLQCLHKDRDQRPETWELALNTLNTLRHTLMGEQERELDPIRWEVQELINKAYALTELREYEEALAEYDRALLREPENSHLWARKGRTLRLANRLEDAQVALTRALTLDPSFAWAWRQVAVILDKLEKYEQSLEAFQRAAELKPAKPWYGYSHALALYKTGKGESALPILYHIVEQPDSPDWSPAQVLIGDILGEMRQYTDALNAYTAALSRRPNDPKLLVRKAQVLRQMGRLEEAAGTFQEITRGRFSSSSSTWVAWAETLHELQKHNEAIGALQQAARLWESHASPSRHHAINGGRIYSLQADAYLKMRRYSEALEACVKALDLHPTPWNHRAHGMILDRLNRLPEALTAYDAALVLHAGDPFAHQGRGQVLLGLNRREDALASYQQASAVAEGTPVQKSVRFWVAQANGYLTLQEPLLALEAAEHALEITPNHVGALRACGDSYRVRGRYAQALESYDQALEIAPNDAQVLYRRGKVQEKMGNLPEAIANYESAAQADASVVWYRINQINPLLTLGHVEQALHVGSRAVRDYPDQVRAWELFGRALRRAGRHEEALPVYEKALSLNPNDQSLWMGKAQSLDALGQSEQAELAFKRARMKPERL